MNRGTQAIYSNDQKVENTKQSNTSKHTSTTRHQVTVDNKMENGGGNLKDIPNTNTWYHFMEMEGQKRVVFDGNLISKRDAILESFSTKFRTQEPWGVENMGQEKRKGGVRYAIEETLKFWDLNISSFH